MRMSAESILIRGANHNNLKNLDLDLPLNELIVVTGVSGSGKSSLAFDTVYAEGQRRYVETFSPYARQFLDRMDKPKVDRIEGIPPAIAIDQTNTVRTSRSTVGTMTELNDHLKLLFARMADLFCGGCGKRVRRDTPQTIADSLMKSHHGQKVLIAFPVTIPSQFTDAEVQDLLSKQGYSRIHRRESGRLEVVQDRLELIEAKRTRLVESIEVALRHGAGKALVYEVDNAGKCTADATRFSSDLHCPYCDRHYADPVPNLFSFNSPIGACPTCRGFGRTIGVDYGLVIPDETKSLAGGAIKTWQTESYKECQDDMMRFAKRREIPTHVPWNKLGAAHKAWVIEGEGSWEDGHWYGTKRFFEWLETKSYKMHIRVLLSKYRSYNECVTCKGARLKPDALLWRVGATSNTTGLNLRELMLLPIDQALRFFASLKLEAGLDTAGEIVLTEIRSRLHYLVDVGLGYLTLDRQSRTLSGGEVQRINLTTALGTSLVNTLFVLDEPSIGLHPRDVKRIVGVLERLRDAGNSLLVVEHDPQIMLAADRILDMGPGPGERGGEVVFFGEPDELMRHRTSSTASYLRRERKPGEGSRNNDSGAPTSWLEIIGATEHNLKQIDVRIPLGRLVCLTGVSGSGKSTLVQDVLYRGLVKLKNRPTEAPGAHKAIKGHEKIDDVVMVDQSPIGRTTRSTPASYVGAFEAIRSLFAALPRSHELGYTLGTFSFNAGTGRCPACGGNGFQHVEMQFLSDVYLRCPDCDGRRYRSDVLEVKMYDRKGRGVSIADTLDMTVQEALEFFSDHESVARGLQPLLDVGLGYMKLGQPVPTLSGGEAQRLKLAGHLAEARERGKSSKGLLFLFDEPTTGLHFQDIDILLKAFRQLIADGHSLVVIEHNLDVMAASDWIIDLGPEGGEDGGSLLAEGKPEDVVRAEHSHTGRALKAWLEQTDWVAPTGALVKERRATYRAVDAIEVRNAREHNLRGVDITIPRQKLTVISGVSGSGKSTVAFDILFAEGQRRYLESLNAYARQFVEPSSRPDVDAIRGIPPTVAIEQRTSRGGRKSTVATTTEIYHFLRLLYVKLGIQHCPTCDTPIEPQSLDTIVARIHKDHRGQSITVLAPLVISRKGFYTDLAKWASGRGAKALRVDGNLISTEKWPRLNRFKEHSIELPSESIRVDSKSEPRLRSVLTEMLEHGKGACLVVETGVVGKKRGTMFSTRRACPTCGTSFPELDPRLFSFNSKHGWCPSCFGTGQKISGFDGEQTGEEGVWNDGLDGEPTVCPTCEGRRLRPEALSVRLGGKSIAEMTSQSVGEAGKSVSRMKLTGRSAEIARDVVAELTSRLAFLREVGLSYLSLDRAAPTLSGGEAQRLRLAAQLGSNLRGVCYILDEPTIGLHARDNRMLLDTLSNLRRKGNTVIVVEHDEDTIRAADHIIDLGPGAGVRGGHVVAYGDVADIIKSSESLTGRFLAHPLKHPLMIDRRNLSKKAAIEVKDATMHNLLKVDARFPIGALVCVTGVSGSGKSSLVRDVLHENVRMLVQARLRGGKKKQKLSYRGCRAVTGWESIRRVLEVDQSPIGKTPRSCPATYIGFWDDIRRLFAGTAEAKMRGYGPGRFSFNVHGGRCDACEGQGYKTIEMSFLPDVKVPCDVCRGARFTPETRTVTWKDKSIAEVLAMSVDEAVPYFESQHHIRHALKLLQDVGLGYLTLGQQSPTLSGGEAQRIKLVTELAKAETGEAGRSTLYVLDEPTVGLHMADVEKLIRVMHRLVDAGNTIVVIEHNLDVIAEADWIIDLGPEGGEGGGRIVAEGTPEQIVKQGKVSHTAKALRAHLL